jgi:nucleoside triphosphatase
MPLKQRICVVGLIYNDAGEYLLTKKPDNLGVYPGTWGLPGGGLEEDEKMQEGLQREMKEEVGLDLSAVEPVFFFDDVATKYYADGSTEELYMVYLMFEGKGVGEVQLNEEAEEYAWVLPDKLKDYAVNDATQYTFRYKGWLQ